MAAPLTHFWIFSYICKYKIRFANNSNSRPKIYIPCACLVWYFLFGIRMCQVKKHRTNKKCFPEKRPIESTDLGHYLSLYCRHLLRRLNHTFNDTYSLSPIVLINSNSSIGSENVRRIAEMPMYSTYMTWLLSWRRALVCAHTCDPGQIFQ